jgi:SWI2/SNF2 ATPase
MVRAKIDEDLMQKLSQAEPRLLCSLVHKFGKSQDKQFDELIKEIQNNPPKVKDELFVFVDECHRTQSGRLHTVMKAILPEAVFIGFTGTPLLKKDKQTSLEVFGKYIHTYKFNEAVEDGVVRWLLVACEEGMPAQLSDQVLAITTFKPDNLKPHKVSPPSSLSLPLYSSSSPALSPSLLRHSPESAVSVPG